MTLTTGNNADISGANLTAENIALNIGNNLNVSSKQTEEDYSSSGFGFNFGVGSSANGKSNIGGGFNISSGDMHRLWVDDVTTIKGTNSLTANIGKDLNLTGAAILSDNLALNVIGDINKKDLQDSYYSESMGIGISTNFTTKGNQATIPGTGGQPNSAPGGSTSISGNYAENESNRTVYATIGGLDSVLTSQTNEMTNGDFEGSLTLDHRLFSESGRNEIQKNFKELPENTKLIAKNLDAPLVILATSDIPGLSYAASYFAGEGGSVATLATQLFGLNYLLDSGNTRFQTNTISNLDNETLAKAIQGKDGFKIQRDIGYETENGQRENFLTITDKNGNAQTFRYTTNFKNLSDVTINDLISTKDYSLHGIDNTSDQAFRNGLMQLGTITNESENGLSFVTLNAPTKGGVFDALENFHNFFLGKTPLASANIIQLQDFSQNLATTAKENNLTDIRMVGHSNGGDRLYLGVLRGVTNNEFQYVDSSGNEGSRLSVQFYGTPSMTSNIRDAADDAGVKYDKTYLHNINSGDFVGNILGANANSAKEAALSVIEMPLLISPTVSPHSSYYCQGSICNFDKVNNATFSQ